MRRIREKQGRNERASGTLLQTKGPRRAVDRRTEHERKRLALLNNEMENSLLSHGILSHRHAALAYR